MAYYDYVVIGGGLAGGRGCEGIRQVDENGSVVLITEENHRPYERPPLSKKYLQDKAGLDRVYLRDKSYYDEKNIEIIQGKEVLQLKPTEKKVLAEGDLALSYGKLLLATGGQAIRLDLPGKSLRNVFTLRTINDSRSIRDAAGNGKKALVMGGSFIGTEVTASLTQLGTEVVQIFPENRLLERIVPQELSDYLFDLYTGKGVRILPGVVASQLDGETYVHSAELDNDEKLDVDLVVMGIGIRLRTGLAEDAGLRVRENDKAVVVDQFLRTSDKDIYAAGDIAAWPDETFEQRLRVEHWDVARRQGRHAGRNMAGENTPYTALPYFYSDLFELSFEVWGNLSNWDQTVTRGSLGTGSFAYYYLNEERLVGVLAVDRPSEERNPMQALVKAQPAYREVAAPLQSGETNLSELAGIEPDDEKETAESSGLSFAEDIAPLFREKDVDEMKEISDFDLSMYEDVRARADQIYERLSDESMPCDEPWPEDQIEVFKRWIEGGKQP